MPTRASSGGSKVTTPWGPPASERVAEVRRREKVLAGSVAGARDRPRTTRRLSTAWYRPSGAPDPLRSPSRRSSSKYAPLRRLATSPSRATAAPRRRARRSIGRGAEISHVRVDRATGEIELLHHVIAQDVGRALNPALVEGQMRGGGNTGNGLGALRASSSTTRTAVPGRALSSITPSRRAERVPVFDTLIVENPAPDGPFGAKGIGEAPVVRLRPRPSRTPLRPLTGTAYARAPADGSPRLGGARKRRLELTVARARADDRRELGRRAPSKAPGERATLRRPHAPRQRHRRDGRRLRRADRCSSTATASCARSRSKTTSPILCLRSRVANERTLAYAERSKGTIHSLCPLRPHRRRPFEEARRCLDLGAPRDQAPPARTGVRAQRRAPAADLRACG